MLMWMYLLTALISLGCVVYYIGNILLMMFLTTTILYLLPKVFHLKQDELPFAFTVMDIMFIVIFKRASMYDMSDNLPRVYEQRSEYGYIALNKKYNFVGASEFAVKLFPELKNIRIDSKIEKCIGDDKCALCKNLMPWVYK